MARVSIEDRISMTEIDGLLVVALPSELTDVVMDRLVEDVWARVSTQVLRGVILNLSTVSLLDLSEFGLLRHLVLTNAVLGVPTVLMGIRPGIAAYLSEMPVQTGDLIFKVDMTSALEVCNG